MESVSVERLDHLGVVVSVIKDLGIMNITPCGRTRALL